MSAQVIHTSEIWMNRQNYLKSDFLRIYDPKYPHFEFACPACGSLDVFVSLRNDKTVGKCLDCSHDWNQLS